MPSLREVRSCGVLIVRGAMEDIVRFKEQQALLLISDLKLSDSELADQQNILAEIQLSPASTLEGMSLKEVDFRRRFGAFVLALSRAGESLREKLGLIPLKRWDTLLVFGPRRSVEQLYKLDDFLPLQEVALRLALLAESFDEQAGGPVNICAGSAISRPHPKALRQAALHAPFHRRGTPAVPLRQ